MSFLPNGWNAPPLDWSTILFQEPVQDWTGLQPMSRMVAQIWQQATGGVPQDPEVTRATSQRQADGPRTRIPQGG